MRQGRSTFSKLMEFDATVPLAIAGFVLCGIGFCFGFAMMFRVAAYGFGGLLLIGMPVLWAYSGHTELEQLRNLKQQHGGRVRRGVPFIGPSFRFQHQGEQASLRIIRRHRRYSPDEIELAVAWADRDQRLDVFPKGLVSMLATTLGACDIHVGRTIFDDAYVVRGDCADNVRATLSVEAQRAIMEMPDQKGLRIQISDGSLRIRSQFYSLTSDVKSFASSALRVYDEMRRME